MTSDTVQGAQDTPSCLSVALEYIRAGIDITVVSSPTCGQEDAGKAPVITGWQTAHLTPEKFEVAYNRRKNQNIGLVTGARSGIICVDLDGADGRAWFLEHQNNLGHFITERRGKNTHLYFKHPGPDIFVPSKLRLFPGVDILADGGRQVVTWPSMHRSGDRYTFDNGLSLLDVQHEADILPQWLIDELAAYAAIRANRVNNRSKETAVFSTNRVNVERCIEELKTIPPGIKGEGRDNQTYKAATICGDFGIPKDQAIKLILEHFNPRCIPPKPQNEVIDKVDNGYQYRKDPIGNRSIEVLFPETPELLQEIAEIEEAEKSLPLYHPKKPIVCAQTYIARNPRMTLASSGQFYSYLSREKRWRYMSDEAISGVILADIEKSDQELHRTINTNQITGMTKMLKLVLQGENPERELKPDTWFTGRSGEFVSCKNGILEIATGHLYPHSSDWFSFTCLPFDYDPAATCPVFESFLDSIWKEDPEQKEALRRWIGYMLIADMSQQKFAVFKGKSRAGKGTVVRVIESLIGHNNYAACSMLSFGNDFGLEPLLGKRAAFFNDAEKSFGDKAHIATERIKTITGNDSIPINRKSLPILTQVLPCKIVFVCNGMPKFINDENAMTNRMIGFDFKESFLGREDTTLKDKLQSEIPGILNWALVGARAIIGGESLIQSQSGRAMITDIDISNDAVKCFVRDCVKITENSYDRVSTKAIWDYFKEWCHDGQYRTGTLESFTKRFKDAIGDKAQYYRTALERGYAYVQLTKESDFDDLTPSVAELDEPPF